MLWTFIVQQYCDSFLNTYYFVQACWSYGRPNGVRFLKKIILCTGKSAQKLSISLYILSRLLIIISTRLLPFIGKQALQSVYSQIPFPGHSGLNADSAWCQQSCFPMWGSWMWREWILPYTPWCIIGSSRLTILIFFMVNKPHWKKGCSVHLILVLRLLSRKFVTYKLRCLLVYLLAKYAMYIRHIQIWTSLYIFSGSDISFYHFW